MIAIAAVDENWAIGKDNSLLFSIPEDMRFFREKTMGNTVVMGRMTLESFPGKKPLKNRRNIVLSGNLRLTIEHAEVVNSIGRLLDTVKDLPPDEVFVVGGASVYKALLPYCKKCYITKMHRTFPADCYFPDLDRSEEWRITEKSEKKIYNELEYEFLTYERSRNNVFFGKGRSF